MRLRNFIILIVVFLLIGAGVLAFFFRDALLGAGGTTETDGTTGLVEGLPAEPTVTPTPVIRLVQVVVTTKRIEMGDPIPRSALILQERPDTNIAVKAGVTFDSIDEVAGTIARTDIARGQEVIKPMLAISPSDLLGFGSDLSLYVNQGRIALAMPIDRYSGVAYAARPGDSVDIMMSIQLVELDPEFKTPLNNSKQDVTIQGEFSSYALTRPEGRFEVIPVRNAIMEVIPGLDPTGSIQMRQISRQTTQLTVQQARVLWLGTWRDDRVNIGLGLGEFDMDNAEFFADPGAPEIEEVAPPTDGTETVAADPNLVPTVPVKPTKERPEDYPDLIIISVSVQDALVLKWALDAGIDIDLVLRSQGDITPFFTTSVSIPQWVEQGGLTIPEDTQFDFSYRIEALPTPGVQPEPNPNRRR